MAKALRLYVCFAAIAAVHNLSANYRSLLHNGHSARHDSFFSDVCFQTSSSPSLTGCTWCQEGPLFQLSNRCCRPKGAIRKVERGLYICLPKSLQRVSAHNRHAIHINLWRLHEVFLYLPLNNQGHLLIKRLRWKELAINFDPDLLASVAKQVFVA